MPSAVVPLQVVLQDDVHAQKRARALHVHGHTTGDHQHIQKPPQHLAHNRVVVTFSNRASTSSLDDTTQPIEVAGPFDGRDGDRTLLLGISRVSTSDRGRIMVADSFIPKGTFLFTLSAQAVVCDSDNRKRRCGSCLKPLQALARGKNNHGGETNSTKDVLGVECEGCNEIWYCHDHPHRRSCKELDYRGIHQFECQFLRQLYHGSDLEYTSLGTVIRLQDPHRKAVDRFRFLDNYEQDYCRLLIRILIHRFKEYNAHGADPHNNAPMQQRGGVAKDEMSMDETPKPLPYSAVEELVENKECVPISKLEGDMTDVAKILDAFQEHLYQQHSNKAEAMNAPRLTLEELLGLVLKEESNSFGLYEYPKDSIAAAADETLVGSDLPSPLVMNPINNAKQGYGLGLYVEKYVYSFNHSCSPNLYHVAHNSQILLYTARDIQCGEELNISYLEFGPHYRIRSESDFREGAVEQQARKEALAKRRAILKHHFYFDCGCSRCMWEATLSDQDSAEKRTGKSMSQGEEAFMREGILCRREGCFGFYAPPSVLSVLGRFYDDSEHWHCVACGCKQY
ncbi:hypothetical protein EC968_008427 [Mortierella alpina]|nr:hypothetical protein EC968_008427 [Mortierella alpina]